MQESNPATTLCNKLLNFHNVVESNPVWKMRGILARDKFRITYDNINDNENEDLDDEL